MQRQRGGLVPNRGLKLAVFSGVWACHNGIFENYSLFTREGRLGNSWHTQIPRGTPGPTVCGIHSSRTPSPKPYQEARGLVRVAPTFVLKYNIRAVRAL